jgi:hypothetical protein
MHTPSQRAAASAVLALFITACGLHDVRIHHLVMFDKHGRAMDPTGICSQPHTGDHGAGMRYTPCNTDFVTAQPVRELGPEYTPYLQQLFAALAADPLANTPEKGTRHTTRKVLLFIHGGLNTDKDTIARASADTDAILAEHYFPIFIGWQSSLVSSWADNLLFVRNGHWYGAAGLPLAPFYLIGDALRSIGRAPIVWTTELVLLC